jgi:hypothetical protein
VSQHCVSAKDWQGAPSTAAMEVQQGSEAREAAAAVAKASASRPRQARLAALRVRRCMEFK